MFLLTVMLLVLPAVADERTQATWQFTVGITTPTREPEWSNDHELNERIPFDMREGRLRFKTSTEDGENVNIMFFGYDGRYRTTLRLQVGSTPKYGLKFCTYDDRREDVWEEFPEEIPDQSEHIWAIEKKNTEVTIYCDGEKVLEYGYKEGATVKCAQKWVPDFHQAKFSKYDNEAVVAYIPEYKEMNLEYFPPPKNMDIPFEMDRHFGRFHTNAVKSNDDPLQSELMLLGDDGIYLGQLSIRFSDPVVYKLDPCTSNEWQEFPEAAVPNYTGITWTIKKSEKHMTVFAHGRLVLRTNFVEAGCDAALSQRIKYINFLGYDTATQYCYCPAEYNFP